MVLGFWFHESIKLPEKFNLSRKVKIISAQCTLAGFILSPPNLILSNFTQLRRSTELRAQGAASEKYNLSCPKIGLHIKVTIDK
jgi:hypothetical protein